MLRFCKRKFPGIGHLQGMFAPIEQVRKLSGLSRSQLGKAMRCSPDAIRKWENRIGNWESGSQRAWLIYIGWIIPDPTSGWLKAALGLPPDGKIPSEVAQQVARAESGLTQVAGYKRRKRKSAS